MEHLSKFKNKYAHLIDFYEKEYGNRVIYSEIKYRNVFPNSLRFIIQPSNVVKYLYIGDVDILITDEILKPHLQNIMENNLDFSNIKRMGLSKLSGLHFIEYEKYYPVTIPKNVDLNTKNDEELLFILMENKGYKIPNENLYTFRPLLGLHASYYSRPPLPYLTTQDALVTDFPSWFHNIGKNDDRITYATKYLQIRYTEKIKHFMRNIKSKDIELRRIIQIIDMSCDYMIKNYKSISE